MQYCASVWDCSPCMILSGRLRAVLSTNVCWQQVYRITAQPVVQSVLAGYNGTFFACEALAIADAFSSLNSAGAHSLWCGNRYGQTGTGKTFTMDGGLEPHLRGVIPRAFDHIFDFIQSGKCNKSQFMVCLASAGLAVQGCSYVWPAHACSWIEFLRRGAACKSAGPCFIPRNLQ